MNLNTKKLFSREFEQRLQILTDLSPKDVQALHEFSEGLPLTVHPSTRNSLKRDNLIVSDGNGFTHPFGQDRLSASVGNAEP